MVKIIATTSTGEFLVDTGVDGEGMVRLLSLRARLLSAPLYLEPLPRQLDLTPYYGPQNLLPQMLAHMTWMTGDDEPEEDDDDESQDQGAWDYFRPLTEEEADRMRRTDRAARKAEAEMWQELEPHERERLSRMTRPPEDFLRRST